MKNKNLYTQKRTASQIQADLAYAMFVPIDIQHIYCDTTYQTYGASLQTEAVARKIGHCSIEFNRHGLPTCWVYMNVKQDTHNRHPYKFYRVFPRRSDDFAGKTELSSFDCYNRELPNLLEKKNVKTLFIAGVYAGACVLKTIEGALREGYRVYVVTDLCANHRDHPGDVVSNIEGNIDDFLLLDKVVQKVADEKNKLPLTFIHSRDLKKAVMEKNKPVLANLKLQA